MIRATGLCKRFPAFEKRSSPTFAVNAIDLEVRQGEVFGLLGPNGAGKTTTVRMLCALIAPTAGQAWINGYELGRDNNAVRASVGILTESPGLYTKLDAVTNLSFFAKLYGVDDVAGQAEKYLRMLGLWQERNRLVGAFSKGMRQKLAIARALLHEPPIVFLDEPTSSLDPEAAHVVREFILELRHQGRTIFLCTHNLDEADRLCDRIAVIKQRLIRVDTPAELRRQLYGREVIVRLRAIASQHVAVVRALPFVQEVRETPDGLVIKLEDPAENNPSLVRALVDAGADVQLVQEALHSLESVYFDLMDQERREQSV